MDRWMDGTQIQGLTIDNYHLNFFVVLFVDILITFLFNIFSFSPAEYLVVHWLPRGNNLSVTLLLQPK